MELESKVFDYYRKTEANRKYNKLKQYYKEVCDQQKEALLRNQALLREFESIEGHIRKLKAEHERVMSRRGILVKQNILRHEGTDIKHQDMPDARQTGTSNRTAMSRGPCRTTTIFMGRPMPAVSTIDNYGSPWKSSPLTKSFSISDSFLYRSDNMPDNCVVQTNRDLPCSNKPDKIDGETYERMGEDIPVNDAGESHQNERSDPLTGGSKITNYNSNFAEKETSPECDSPLDGGLPSGLKNDNSCKLLEGTLTHQHSVNGHGSEQPIPPMCQPGEPVSGSEHSRENIPALGDSLQTYQRTQDERESPDESSGFTISISEDEEETTQSEPHQNAHVSGCNNSFQPVNVANEELQDLQPHDATSVVISSSSPAKRECLSLKGFSHLLKFMEEMVASWAPGSPSLCEKMAVNAAERKKLIRICNKTGSLKWEDFEACKALFHHQLQKLLSSAENKSLLPEEEDDDKSEILEESTRSQMMSLMKAFEQKHAGLLKIHNVALEKEREDVLGTLPIVVSQERGSQASLLLKQSFPEAPEKKALSDDDNTSSSSQQKNIFTQQEVTSGSEDESKEESLVEKIPITGLEMDGSGFKEQKSDDGTSSEPSFTPLKGSPLSRDKKKKKPLPTIKSKAFWGDSDDSYSDIEAALCPQAPCLQEEEGFDDFYD